MSLGIARQSLQFGQCIGQMGAMGINNVRDDRSALFGKKDEVRPDDLSVVAPSISNAQRILTGPLRVAIPALETVPFPLRRQNLDFPRSQLGWIQSPTV